MASTGAIGAVTPLIDHVTLEDILSICHDGDFVLADERLSAALTSLGSKANPGGPERNETGVSGAGLSGDEQAQLLVGACVEAGDPQRAASWLERLHAAGLGPGTETLLAVLTALLAKDLRGDAEELFTRLRAAGARADERSYNTLIFAAGRAGDVVGAETWFNRMQVAGLRPSATSYAAVLRACAMACDHRHAERWMARMGTVGVAPDVACYLGVMEACAAAGCAERSEMWLRHVTGTPGLAPTGECYAAAAQAYAAQGDYSDVERLQEEMEQRGLGTDELNMSVLLVAYANAGPSLAERAERAMRGYAARGLPVTAALLRELRGLLGGPRVERLLAAGLLGPRPAGG